MADRINESIAQQIVDANRLAKGLDTAGAQRVNHLIVCLSIVLATHLREAHPVEKERLAGAIDYTSNVLHFATEHERAKTVT